MTTPCLICRFISEDEDACYAGPILEIPWSEPIDFHDEFNDDAPIEYPKECFMVEELTETVSYLNSDLEELIEESDNLPLQRKLKELNMWQNWLEIVSHNAQKW